MNDSQIEQELRKTIHGFRRLGLVFLVAGTGMLVIFLFTLFDPAGAIRVNGVETREFSTKLGVAAFIAVFPIIGSILVFLPQKTIEPLFRHIFHQVAEIAELLGRKK